MIDSLFSFSGRLNRLSYFGYCMVLGLGAGIIWGILLVGGVSFAMGGKLGQLAGVGLLALLLLLPFTWSALALTAKRLRDAGFPPIIVMPAMILFSIIDHFFLAKTAITAGPATLLKASLIGIVVKLIYTGVLLFWPSKADTDTTSGPRSRLEDLVQTDPNAWARSIVDPKPLAPLASMTVQAQAPALAPAGARASFGRRRAC